MRFDDQGRPLGGEMITDATIVEQHCAWRDLAVHHATDPEGTASAHGRDVA
jgi:hypothetical protein